MGAHTGCSSAGTGVHARRWGDGDRPRAPDAAPHRAAGRRLARPHHRTHCARRPGAAPSGGTNGAAAPSAGPAQAVDDLVVADASAPITICGIAVALLGDAVGACPTRGDDAASTADTAAAEAALAEYVAGADADLGITLCGIAVAVAGDATGACPATAPGGGPALALDVPGVGTVDRGRPVTVCGIAVGLVNDTTGACPG